MIEVYTGNGKGKTTAAIGLAIRALGHSKRVYLIQFLKTQLSGELRILKKLKDIRFYCFGRKKFCRKGNLSQKDYSLAQQGFAKAKFIVERSKPDMLILDELNLVLYFGLLPLAEVVEFLKEIPRDIEIVITGRRAPKEIAKLADLVSEVKEIKHYSREGYLNRNVQALLTPLIQK